VSHHSDTQSHLDDRSRPAVVIAQRRSHNLFMIPSSRTPEGLPERCPVCGNDIRIDPSLPAYDAPCPYCGHLLWFARRWSDFPEFGRFTIRDESIRSGAQAISAVFDRLAESEHLDAAQRKDILKGLHDRESLGSTAVGNGLAIPHAKHPRLGRLIGAVAGLPGGVDFKSLDGQPVYVVCLFVSPVGRSDEHLRVLETIARYARG
jgi:mannitol/fructose-specific phosphotransferase system IIA component (Ntr-type)